MRGRLRTQINLEIIEGEEIGLKKHTKREKVIHNIYLKFYSRVY